MIERRRLFAQAIAAVLETGGIEGASASHETPRLGQYDRFDVILVEVSHGEASTSVVARSLLAAKSSSQRVVALIPAGDPALVDAIIEAGFDGYVTKQTSAAGLAEALHAAYNGDRIQTGGRRPSSRPRPSRLAQGDYAAMAARHLTSRERQVLALLAEGAGKDQIARQLDIKPNTVRTHIQNVFTKLQVHSRIEAVTLAVRAGIVRPRPGLLGFRGQVTTTLNEPTSGR